MTHAYSLSAGHEQDGGAADDGQDHGNDHQDRLYQLGIRLGPRLFFDRLQSLDPAALPVVALHTSAALTEQNDEPRNIACQSLKNGETDVASGGERTKSQDCASAHSKCTESAHEIKWGKQCLLILNCKLILMLSSFCSIFNLPLTQIRPHANTWN